jgi:hypothetical protein
LHLICVVGCAYNQIKAKCSAFPKTANCTKKENYTVIYLMSGPEMHKL